MTIKLVATDMDGTFLDGNGRFDMDRLKSLLVSYKGKKGIYFGGRLRGSRIFIL